MLELLHLCDKKKYTHMELLTKGTTNSLACRAPPPPESTIIADGPSSTYRPHSPGPALAAESLRFGGWRYAEGWPAASWRCCCCYPFWAGKRPTESSGCCFHLEAETRELEWTLGCSFCEFVYYKDHQKPQNSPVKSSKELVFSRTTSFSPLASPPVDLVR